VKEEQVDYSNYFWQGDKVRLRPVTLEDAESCFADSFDSPARQVLQLGMELPSSVEAQREELEKYTDCKDVNGVRVFSIETHDGARVGGISMHTRNRKNGTFGLGMIISPEHRGNGYGVDAGRILLRYMFHERRYQKCNSACVEPFIRKSALSRRDVVAGIFTSTAGSMTTSCSG
jgi:RimJ/RimL family protein N-acetyltransferase